MASSGMKLTASKSNKWVKGQSGNPKGRKPGVVNRTTMLRQRFTDARAQDVLECVFNAAHNDPATARWLAARLFGGGSWAELVMPASIQTVEECKAAMEGLLDAFVSAQISEDQMMTLNEALLRRLVYLENTQNSGKANG